MGSTDVLKADRFVVDDRIYRVLPIRDSLKLNDEDGSSKSKNYKIIFSLKRWCCVVVDTQSRP